MPKGIFTPQGRVGQYRYGGVFYEEFLPELRGPKGVEVYKEMSENDDIVSAILFAIEMLMRQTTFSVDPSGDTDIDKRAAEFVKECMDDMQDSWTSTLSEILSFITFGWSYHEIVYKRRMGHTKNPKTNSKYDDGLIGWRKLPLRAQETLYEWLYEDQSDELIGMVQQPPPDFGTIEIPLDRALHFVTKSRKNNPEGRSVLRGAYRAWYFKRRIQEIEGIGLERDLAGFPVLTAPERMDLWDTDDPEMVEALNRAESIVTGIRRDSREGLVLPPGWELSLLSAGNRRTFDTNEIIDRYDKRIATTVMADFILLGQGDNGSWALSSDKTRLFSLAIGTYLDVICETFNTQGIPRLIDLNDEHFRGITDYPQMVHSDIEERNLKELSEFLEKMVGIGLLMPDDQLEDFVRTEANLPERLDAEDMPEPVLSAEEKKQFRLDQAQSSLGRKDTSQAETAEESNQKENKKQSEKKQKYLDEEDVEKAAAAKQLLGRSQSMKG
ncbi:hypothetical protein OBO34_19510 [Clostridiales Family XIII bacterium ASD5510]|uniref:Portal protein n=1 Tax=Hominibacterium faecale TaxID=2839743 RepID=A0A9J6QYD8_9FIRM|nr:hypothetical protein [Hominibacterium faecale]MCU7380503.1 hypothetical protein [Hominibacterium faecale]